MSAEVLMPDATLELGGREVTVREFTFKQGLEISPLLVNVIADLDETIGDGGDLSGLIDHLYAHPEALQKMLLLSTEQDQDWLDSLSGADGDKLVMTFFSVNADFFIRRLVVRRQMASQSKALKAQS